MLQLLIYRSLEYAEVALLLSQRRLKIVPHLFAFYDTWHVFFLFLIKLEGLAQHNSFLFVASVRTLPRPKPILNYEDFAKLRVVGWSDLLQPQEV